MSEAEPGFLAGAVQWAPEFLEPVRGAEKAASAIAEAAAAGAKLLVFPEAWLVGYPYWSGIMPADPEYQMYRQLLFERAVTLDGPEFGLIRAAAADHGMTVVMGHNERVGSTLHCSLAYIGADGRLLGNHRKLIPTQAERLVWGRGDGSDLEAYDTPFGKLGGLNCFEHQMAPARYALCGLGVQLHASAWPGHAFLDGLIDASTRHLSHENGCFVIVARECMSPERVGASVPAPDRTAAHFHTHGGSAIIAPGGDYLAGPVFDTETIVLARIDLARIGVVKWFFDGVGHYAAPEVFSLRVDRRPKPSLTFVDHEGSAP